MGNAHCTIEDETHVLAHVKSEPEKNASADNRARVLEHLIFHKAIISEESSEIDDYIAAVDAQLDPKLAKAGKMDREITAVFELVLKHKLDPWDIDLVKFSTLYLNTLKKDKTVDLVIAGYLVLLAFTILKMQSENVLAMLEEPEDEISWDVIPDWTFGDEDYEYTQLVMQGDVALEPKLRHQGRRKVSLFELLGALNQAKKTIELKELTAHQRAEARARDLEATANILGEKIHVESIDEHMSKLWSKICDSEKPLPFSRLCNGCKSELVRSILSVLFLADRGKVQVWQRPFPYGEIYVRRIVS